MYLLGLRHRQSRRCASTMLGLRHRQSRCCASTIACSSSIRLALMPCLTPRAPIHGPRCDPALCMVPSGQPAPGEQCSGDARGRGLMLAPASCLARPISMTSTCVFSYLACAHEENITIFSNVSIFHGLTYAHQHAQPT